MSHLPIPKKLSQWLVGNNTQIGYYQTKVEQLLSFNSRWKQQVHIPLASHSTIANWENTTLVLAVDHSGWASQLHYEKQALCQLFNTWPRLSKIIEIKWYVKAPDSQSLKIGPTKKKIPLSESNRYLLQSVASTLSNLELSDALVRLANQRD